MLFLCYTIIYKLYVKWIKYTEIYAAIITLILCVIRKFATLGLR